MPGATAAPGRTENRISGPSSFANSLTAHHLPLAAMHSRSGAYSCAPACLGAFRESIRWGDPGAGVG
jgi:hypothetical protein